MANNAIIYIFFFKYQPNGIEKRLLSEQQTKLNLVVYLKTKAKNSPQLIIS